MRENEPVQALKTSYRGNEGLIPAANFYIWRHLWKKKVCRKLSYMLLWESLFIYMMEQSANWPLLLHINIWRNYTEHTVDGGGTEWTIIRHSLYKPPIRRVFLRCLWRDFKSSWVRGNRIPQCGFFFHFLYMPRKGLFFDKICHWSFFWFFFFFMN